MSKELRVLDMSLPVGSIDAYYYQVNKIPVLSAEREYELATRWKNFQDIDAARELVLAHLRYVARIAKNYSGYGLATADLIQEGNIGLMKAVRRFDPEMGVRLVSFAVHWIKAEIHEFILKNWRIVKIATTKAQRKLFFNLRNARKRLGWFTQEEISQVACDLGVSQQDVIEMEQRLNAQDTSFEAPEDDSDESGSTQNSFAPVYYLTAPNSDPAEQIETTYYEEQQQDELHQALAVLDTRSQDILKKRWLNNKKATLHELAAEYNVSAERIRQLENNALKKLKLTLNQSDVINAQFVNE